MTNENIYEITEKAIDSVPKAVITNNSKINQYIQLLCKKVLELSNNRRDGHANDEVGILASLDGTFEIPPIYGYWNEERKTSIIEVENNYNYQEAVITKYINSLVFVHNHPNNSNLSYGDLMNLITTEAIYITVAVSNNGGIYFAYKTYDDFRDYINLYKKLQYAVHNAEKSKRALCIDSIYNKIINNPEKYGLFIGFSRRSQ